MDLIPAAQAAKLVRLFCEANNLQLSICAEAFATGVFIGCHPKHDTYEDALAYSIEETWVRAASDPLVTVFQTSTPL